MKKELITSKFKVLVKKHLYVFLLLLITLVFFSSILSSSKILSNIHYVNDMTFQSENIRIYLHESGAIPLWTPYFYAGQPFIAIPEHYLFDLNFIYIFLFKNIYLSMNLALISYFFLAGLGMYLLIYEILRKQNAAFIAALIFMFSGVLQRFALHGHLNILESYALMPFVFLFTPPRTSLRQKAECSPPPATCLRKPGFGASRESAALLTAAPALAPGSIKSPGQASNTT